MIKGVETLNSVPKMQDVYLPIATARPLQTPEFVRQKVVESGTYASLLGSFTRLNKGRSPECVDGWLHEDIHSFLTSQIPLTVQIEYYRLRQRMKDAESDCRYGYIERHRVRLEPFVQSKIFCTCAGRRRILRLKNGRRDSFECDLIYVLQYLADCSFHWDAENGINVSADWDTVKRALDQKGIDRDNAVESRRERGLDSDSSAED